MTPSCGQCRFFDADYGQCRRRAPTSVKIIDGQPSAQSAFPPVTPDMWCGEFESKEAPDGSA